MTQMYAAVLEKLGQFNICEIERPVPQADEALVKVARTRICGTDIHIFLGRYAADISPRPDKMSALGRSASRLW